MLDDNTVMVELGEFSPWSECALTFSSAFIVDFSSVFWHCTSVNLIYFYKFFQAKIDLMNAKNLQDENVGKDTHMDLDLDMWITHNKTKVKT